MTKQHDGSKRHYILWIINELRDEHSHFRVCRMTIKNYLIDNTNFLGKRWCLAFSMHFLTLATLLDIAVSVCTYEVFCFTGMMHVLPKIVLILPGTHSSSSHEKKKVAKFVYFLENAMYNCLIFWISKRVCINLAVNPALFRLGVRETSLGLSKIWVDYNTRFSISISCTKNN